MSSLVIVKPYAPTAASGVATYDRALTSDPKETMLVPGTGGNINIDFGTAVAVDSLFLGYHTATADQQFVVISTGSLGGAQTGVLFPVAQATALGGGPPYHAFYRAGAPMTSRYWQIQLNGGTGNVAWQLGVAALGLAFQPYYGREYGSGRGLDDTSTVTRLFGGGFGIDEGAIAPWWQWTMGDLTDAEVQTLYRMLRNTGESRRIIVAEDPDRVAGQNEGLHYGLLAKIDAYDRFAPGASRWSLRVNEWL
jgi:hypothetical protein